MVSGFGRFVRADNTSKSMKDLRAFRCRVAVDSIREIPQRLAIVLGDDIIDITVHLESAERIREGGGDPPPPPPPPADLDGHREGNDPVGDGGAEEGGADEEGEADAEMQSEVSDLQLGSRRGLGGVVGGVVQDGGAPGRPRSRGAEHAGGGGWRGVSATEGKWRGDSAPEGKCSVGPASGHLRVRPAAWAGGGGARRRPGVGPEVEQRWERRSGRCRRVEWVPRLGRSARGGGAGTARACRRVGGAAPRESGGGVGAGDGVGRERIGRSWGDGGNDGVGGGWSGGGGVEVACVVGGSLPENIKGEGWVNYCSRWEVWVVGGVKRVGWAFGLNRSVGGLLELWWVGWGGLWGFGPAGLVVEDGFGSGGGSWCLGGWALGVGGPQVAAICNRVGIGAVVVTEGGSEGAAADCGGSGDGSAFGGGGVGGTEPGGGSRDRRGGGGVTRASRRLANGAVTSALDKAIARKARVRDIGGPDKGPRGMFSSAGKIQKRSGLCGVRLGAREAASFKEFASSKA